MNVKLISYTPDPLKTLYIAARTCYSSYKPEDIEATDEKKMEKLINEIIERGHLSILEHISFTFAISGVSRVLTHQLVRHRLASYSQQSQRYVKMKSDIVIPPSILKDKGAEELFNGGINKIYEIYRDLINLGIPKEDARFILPNAAKTNIVMTMNYREILHTASLRLCPRAQWEIRYLFAYIKWEIKKVSKFLASYIVPRCITLGYCPEKETCGLMPKRGSNDCIHTRCNKRI